MRTIGNLPGELNGTLISSIINLICPQCGGRIRGVKGVKRDRRKVRKLAYTGSTHLY